MAKAIMVQGTMSNAGKSLICAGLCRVFAQEGLRVAPFKSQNMSLNSFITREGLEMGRAQVVQAEAAGIEPSVRMNPILLKPVSNMGSQVIVNGEVRGNFSTSEYYAMKHTLLPDIMAAYNALSTENDVIVIEGAGSPAEINLKQGDFVNMGMAKLAKAPVLLVGDIDRGGVFAQLFGTVTLLDPDEQNIVKAMIINKFRGDVTLLEPGLRQIEALVGKPVAGVLPMLDVDIDDEDSLSERLHRRNANAMLDIAVIRLPHLSNFTDFAVLEATAGIGVRYVSSEQELGSPDLVILPGTKSTISDLRWMRQCGLEASIRSLAALQTPILGICGGYQMLGKRIIDPDEMEGGGEISGLGLLPVTTVFALEKHRTRVTGRICHVDSILCNCMGTAVDGYEIHMGQTTLDTGARPFVQLSHGAYDGCSQGNVFGTYLHGFFDSASCREAVLGSLAASKGLTLSAPVFDLNTHKEKQYDLLAQSIREHIDMGLVRRILEEGL